MIAVLFATVLAVSHADLPQAAPSWQAGGAPARDAGGDTAAEIAHALNARETLRSMILMALAESDDGLALTARLGETRADALFSTAADIISWRYVAQWEANVATAYRETLSAEELANVLSGLRRNDRTPLEPFAARVGLALFRNASPLIRQASAETLAAVRQRNAP